MSGRKVITVSTRLKDVKSAVQKLLGAEYELVYMDEPLHPSLVHETDYLLADFPRLEPILFQEPGRLSWIQGTWAGIDKLKPFLDKSEKKPKFLLSRLSHPDFSQLMTEYCLAAVLNIERNFSKMRESQAKQTWDKDSANSYRSLRELNIGILGLGEIGMECAKTFKGLGSRIVGMVTKPRPADPIVDHYYTKDQMNVMLQQVDYLINILPSTPETNNILNSDVLSNCKNVGFINIGRGNVIANDDIIRALDAGWFREAYLDVFPVEPLPEDSPLWLHPKVTVSPHVAAESRAREVTACLYNNLQRLQAGQLPASLVNWDKLY